MTTMPSVEEDQQQLLQGRSMIQSSRQKLNPYPEEELEQATPFGRVILQELNRTRSPMAYLTRHLGVYRTTMMGMIYKPNWKVSLGQIFQIAEFFKGEPWTFLIRLYGQSREREMKAALLLDRFMRLGDNEQGLVVTMIEALVKRADTSPLTQEQEELANRLLISPEMRRLGNKHQQEEKKKEDVQGHGG